MIRTWSKCHIDFRWAIIVYIIRRKRTSAFTIMPIFVLTLNNVRREEQQQNKIEWENQTYFQNVDMDQLLSLVQLFYWNKSRNKFIAFSHAVNYELCMFSFGFSLFGLKNTFIRTFVTIVFRWFQFFRCYLSTKMWLNRWNSTRIFIRWFLLRIYIVDSIELISYWCLKHRRNQQADLDMANRCLKNNSFYRDENLRLRLILMKEKTITQWIA